MLEISGQSVTSAVSPPPDSPAAPRSSFWRRWHTLSLGLLVLTLALLETLAPPTLRFWTWLVSLALMLLIVLIAGQGVTGLWLGLLIDTRNKLSLARFQMMTWTILILSAYLTAVMVNIDLQHPDPLVIAIAPDLWLLMGISTTSMIGSPLILSVKKRRMAPEVEKERALSALTRQAVDLSKVAIIGQLVVNQHPEQARWSDLFKGSETGNVGQLDLGKMQMFLFSLILVLAYAAAVAALFQQGRGVVDALPGVDGGTLALLGISHAGYLVNKALPHSDIE
ncbi:MAG: hypothetical protein JNM70_01150 [Anaerolineae bacterium]|nr:hypothetical protein [Anaerolineae bacterium]